MKQKKFSGGLVYSTDPSAMKEEPASQAHTEPAKHQLKVILDKKQRAGKVVTVVYGFEIPDSGIDALARQLKAHCGTGGSAKDGEIILQGDHRDKVVSWLQKKGFTKTKKI